MSNKPANPKNDAAKKTTRRKKNAETAAEIIAEAPAVTAPVEDTPVKKARKPRAKKTEVKAEAPAADAPKKRGRKPKSETAAAEAAAEKTVSAAEEAPAKKRGRKPKAVSAADAPVKKRGRKKAAPEIVAEAAPPVAAETAFADSEPVEIKPDVVVELADEPLPGQIALDGSVTEGSAPARSETPAKKTRKPRTKKADAAPKRRGRPPKDAKPALVLTTTLQVGDTEFDISALAEKAYKEYKRVHKRKIVTDFHLYVKPEEGAAYYTVNGEGSEDFKVELK